MVITVPEAARRTGRNPETIRRWIREGKLPSTKVGTQHLVDEEELDLLLGSPDHPLPEAWKTTMTGEPMPNWVELVRRSRASH